MDRRSPKICINNVDILPNTYKVPNWWFQAKSLLSLVVEWGKEISLSGKILNCRKIQTIFRSNFFPLIFFLQKWHTTHLKLVPEWSNQTCWLFSSIDKIFSPKFPVQTFLLILFWLSDLVFGVKLNWAVISLSCLSLKFSCWCFSFL